jgi:hypothetical protein
MGRERHVYAPGRLRVTAHDDELPLWRKATARMHYRLPFASGVEPIPVVIVFIVRLNQISTIEFAFRE